MKSYRITYKRDSSTLSGGLNKDNTDTIQADTMILTPTGAIMFVEQPAIQRGQANPQGEIMVERLEASLCES